MKNIFRFVFAVFCVLATMAPLHAQWIQVDNWSGEQYITGLAVSGRNLVAGTPSNGVFFSSNNGASWTHTNARSSLYISYRAFAQRGSNLFTGQYGEILVSIDNGATWNSYGSIGIMDLTVLAVSGGILFGGGEAGLWVVGNPYGIGPHERIKAIAVSGTNLFVGTDVHGIFLSTNNGAKWSAVNTGLTNTSVPSLAVSGTNLFAGTYGGVFLSTNNGTSWTKVLSGLTNPVIQCLAVSGTNIFAGTSGDGVFLSTNNGTSWTAVNSGLTNPNIQCLVVSGTNLFAGTTGGVFLSADNGLNWTAVNTGFTSKLSALAVSGTELCAGTLSGDILKFDFVIGRSLSGSRINVVSTFSISALALAASPIAGTTITSIFAANHAGSISMTNTQGLTPWKIFINSFTSPLVTALAVSGTSLYAGTSDGGLFRSTIDNHTYSNGLSWTAVNSKLANNISALASSGTNLFAGTDSGAILFSTDNGSTWTTLSISPRNNISALAVSGSKIVAGTLESGILLSVNNGATWTAVNSGLTNLNITSLAIWGTRLFAVTSSNNLWMRPLDELTPVLESRNDLPREYALHQNYPNPFNPTTKISFSLPTRSFVSLKVFDLMGREVSTIVSDELSAGDYLRRWNAEGLPSGVYFYRLEAGSFVETKKLVLLR